VRSEETSNNVPIGCDRQRNTLHARRPRRKYLGEPGAEDHNGNGRPDFTPVAQGGDLDGVDNDGNGFVDDFCFNIFGIK